MESESWDELHSKLCLQDVCSHQQGPNTRGLCDGIRMRTHTHALMLMNNPISDYQNKWYFKCNPYSGP